MKRTERCLFKISASFKSLRVFIFLSLLLTILSSCNGNSKESSPETKEDAFRILGREQSLAESYVYMLNEFGKNDLGGLSYMPKRRLSLTD